MWEHTEDNEQVDLTPFIDPLVLLAGLLMILMPSIKSLHIEKSQLVQNAYGAESQMEPDEQILLEFSQQSIYAKQEEREYSYAEMDSLISSIPAGSTVLLAGDADCTYQKSLQLKSALSQAGFAVQELSLAKGEE
jgi:biopolymer transport protein ExbD